MRGTQRFQSPDRHGVRRRSPVDCEAASGVVPGPVCGAAGRKRVSGARRVPGTERDAGGRDGTGTREGTDSGQGTDAREGTDPRRDADIGRDEDIRRGVGQAHRIVVKIGSSSLTTAAGGLDADRVDALVDVLAKTRDGGARELVLVSSGAIAAGLAPLSCAAAPRTSPGSRPPPASARGCSWPGTPRRSPGTASASARSSSPPTTPAAAPITATRPAPSTSSSRWGAARRQRERHRRHR